MAGKYVRRLKFSRGELGNHHTVGIVNSWHIWGFYPAPSGLSFYLVHKDKRATTWLIVSNISPQRQVGSGVSLRFIMEFISVPICLSLNRKIGDLIEAHQAGP